VNAAAASACLPDHVATTPATEIGIVIESMRPTAIGPSSAMSASHVHAGARPPGCRSSSQNAMPSSTVTTTSHMPGSAAGPAIADAAIGSQARIGYTHGPSMPTTSPCIARDAHHG